MPAQIKVLVTGGAGYIGSVVTKKLLLKGYQVVVLDNFSYSDMGISHLKNNLNLSLVKGDIRNESLLRQSLKGVRHVIHLAAIANDPSGELDPNLTRSINLDSYPRLLEASRQAGVRRFINASTFSVYGINPKKNITETEALNPLKEYSICKAQSETMVKSQNAPGFTTVSLRCATVCGWSRRMRFDLIVNTLAGMALVDEKLVVWGGDQQRPQIHVDDLSRYFVALLSLPAGKIGGQVFNAGGENASILEIAETINQVLKGSVSIEQAQARADERSYHVSSQKIATELGLSPKKSIKDAIVSIVTAYHAKLWTAPFEPIYHNLKQMRLLGVA
jgi:nucleoside-diphosphate-sugar epimerase